MEQEVIASESLRFLENSMQTWAFPHTEDSLPFPKELMKEAIKSYVRTATLTSDEINGIKIYYGYLANFLPKEQVDFVTKVNDELEAIGTHDLEKAKDWLKVPANDERQGKVVAIMAQTSRDRDILRKEIEEITGATKGPAEKGF